MTVHVEVLMPVAAGLLLAMAAGRRGRRAQQVSRARGRLAPDADRARLLALARWVAGGTPPWLHRQLDAADVAVDTGVLVTAWLFATVLGAALALVAAGPGLAVAGSGAAIGGPVIALRLLGGRRDARIEAALPLALEAMARSLRTAASLRQAVGEAAAVTGGRLGVDLAAVAARVDHGMPLIAALDGWVVRRPLAGVRLAAAALALGAETGGAQARAIDGVAATIRERLAAGAEMHAQATQARASAAVIALAPVLFCALASATDARTATFLFRTPAGLAVLTAGLALDGVGALWMGRITRTSP